MTFGSATCGLGLLAIRDPMHYLAVSTLERVRIEPHKLCHTPVFPATRACRNFLSVQRGLRRKIFDQFVKSFSIGPWRKRDSHRLANTAKTTVTPRLIRTADQ